MNPLALLPTWEARAEHMDKVAVECEKQGLTRSATLARVNAETFRMLAEEGVEPEEWP